MRFSALIITFFGLATLLTLNRCKKEAPINGTGISFSKDTLTFDTVFTSLGSTTRFFKVRNSTNKNIVIQNIELAGLQGNQFRINVDGVFGRKFSNVEVLAKDSIYVFVEVTVNPNAANAPFVITDDVNFLVDGVPQKVVLQAWGQNAYYHLGTRYSVSNPPPLWLTDKPHIILRGDSFPGMEVPAGVTLNIPSGTRIFMGPSALMSIDGTLNALANPGDSISFDGLRLESFYQNRPGQWLGIVYGRPAKINMRGCVITESTFGLSDEHILNVIVGRRITTSNLQNYSISTPEIKLDRCIIKHTAGSALTAIASKLEAVNCLFHTAGGNLTALFLGGDYEFNHCTMANVFNQYVEHKTECVVVTDRLVDIDNTPVLSPSLSARFTNCVAYGSLKNELGFVTSNPSSQIFFDHCVMKVEADTFARVNHVDCKLNTDPKFKTPNRENYTPDSLRSPLTNAGLNTGVMTDLWGKTRDAQPDIGAIEWQP